ncbi:MAG: sugar phosphate isomerase/epimerase [Planctomycetes bacterium]|nr:sugar phosphate isomerase/epimerase [Planctomycetota bacterium]
MKFLQGTISYADPKWGPREKRVAENTPLADFLDEIASVGADGIELWGYHLDGLGEAEVEALAKDIADSGQEVTVLSPYWDFSSSDEAVERSLEDAGRYLALKDVFGSRTIRVFVGAPGSAEAAPDNWERAINGLGRLARMYDSAGVTFVVETHNHQLPDTPRSCVRLMNELNEPSIRINYQNMGGAPAEELDVVFPWVSHVHVSPHPKFAKTADEVIADLVGRGYDSTMTVEFCTDSLPEEGREFDRAKAIAGMRADIEHLRSIAG